MSELMGSGADRYRLAFTDEEERLVAKIDLRRSHANHDEAHTAYLENQEPILALLKSLSDRDGVPAQRISYWNDPEYQPGRLKGSHKELFERNDCRGEDIYTHPHFIKHLRYILLGADLPQGVITAFEAEVGNPEWVSYGDSLDLGKKARNLVRQYGLSPHEACEEFFKLALDLKLGASKALRIRGVVRETR